MAKKVDTQSSGYKRVLLEALKFLKDQDIFYFELLKAVRISEKSKEKTHMSTTIDNQDFQEEMFNLIRIGALDYTSRQEYVTTPLGKEIVKRVFDMD